MKGIITLFANSQSEQHGSLEALRGRLNNLLFFLDSRGHLTAE